MSVYDSLPPPRPDRIADVLSEGGLRAPPELGPWGKFWWWLHFAILVKLARLRFIAILALLGGLIVYWDTLVAYYEKWTHHAGSEQAGNSDYEYFCPMHPQVVTNNPKEKCPICAMNLSKRKKAGPAASEALPPGVVQRMQLSPYQVVTAGIRTGEIGYEPLIKKIEAVGTVEYDERNLKRVSARIKGRLDKLYVKVTGEMVHKGDPLADIYSPELVVAIENLRDARDEGTRKLLRRKLRLLGIDDAQVKEMEQSKKEVVYLTLRAPVDGYIRKRYQNEGDYVNESAPILDVADLSAVWIEAQVYEEDMSFLKLGERVSATTEALPGRTFTGKIAQLYPNLDALTRTLRVRFNLDNPDHEKRPEVSLRPGMFATVRVDVPVVAAGFQPAEANGKVLAVPEDAVVYTGSLKVVYRRESETVFDAVPVELGPLVSGPKGVTFYPLLSGLRAGDQVVTVGSYLLDAETRVSAAAGSIYYGGGGASKSGTVASAQVRPTTPEDKALKVKTNLAKLSTSDQRLAESQKLCPIQKVPLGSMGPLVKVMLNGQPVLLCCKGCKDDAEKHPDKTLATVAKFKKAKGTPPVRDALAEKLAKVQAGLAKLSESDRRLAEAQKYCPVQQDKLLGVMGKPFKVMLDGRPVFLCCPSCEDEARENPARTLATVDKLKARAKGETLSK